jgi:hypothetical protein
MSLAARQQRAYDAREVSVLEQVRSGTDPFTAAINAIRGVKIPYNKQTGFSIFTDLFSGIGDAVASIWGANTSSFSNAVRSQFYEGNYNIAQGKSFAGGEPIGAQILGGVSRGPGNPTTIVFKESSSGSALPFSNNVGRIDAGNVPAFEDFWDTGTPTGANAPGQSETAFPWSWVALGLGVLGILFFMGRR